MNITDFVNNRNIVFIGEAGSGKTELAMNVASKLAETVNNPVVFLDMDQTKPLFRARNVAELLKNKGVIFEIEDQFLDAPVVPHGVIASLQDKTTYTLMDVGGNKAGALCLGQYSQELLTEGAQVYYTINPYRCFSDTVEHISQTMNMILACCRIDDIRIVGNPYIGKDTTIEDYKVGAKKLESLVTGLGMSIYAWMIPTNLMNEIKDENDNRYICIDSYMQDVLDVY